MNQYLILRYASTVVRKITAFQLCCAGLACLPFVLTEHISSLCLYFLCVIYFLIFFHCCICVCSLAYHHSHSCKAALYYQATGLQCHCNPVPPCFELGMCHFLGMHTEPYPSDIVYNTQPTMLIMLHGEYILYYSTASGGDFC